MEKLSAPISAIGILAIIGVLVLMTSSKKPAPTPNPAGDTGADTNVLGFASSNSPYWNSDAPITSPWYLVYNTPAASTFNMEYAMPNIAAGNQSPQGSGGCGCGSFTTFPSGQNPVT